jgi:hypothetical protein
VPTPESDPDLDNDGRDNLLEYFEGTLPLSQDVGPASSIAIESLEVSGLADSYVILRFARRLAADDVDVRAEVSGDLVNWKSGPEVIVYLGRERTGPTTENLVFRLAAPGLPSNRRFARVRVQSR